MKYPYIGVWPSDPSGKSIKRPMVGITVFGPAGKHETYLSLIDSGADRSLFNIAIAKSLGIDLLRAKREVVRGIYGDAECFFVKEVEIQVPHLEKIKVPASFIDSPYVGILLGEEGFFDKNKIKFEKDHDVFEIKAVKG